MLSDLIKLDLICSVVLVHDKVTAKSLKSNGKIRDGRC